MTNGTERQRGRLLDEAVEMLGESGRGGVFRVSGPSMLPLLAPGQRVAVEFSPDRLDRGDVILFRQGESLLLHRLLGPARTRDGQARLRTRGDGAAVLDPPIDPANVVGRVVAIEDGSLWRTSRSSVTKRYGRCLAWHALVWAGLAWVARIGDRAVGSLKIPGLLVPLVTAVDHGVLRLVHRMLFVRSHPVVPVPEEAGGQGR